MLESQNEAGMQVLKELSLPSDIKRPNKSWGVVVIAKFHFANQAYVGPNGTLRAQNKRMSITLYYIRIQRRCSQYYKAEEKNFVKF